MSKILLLMDGNTPISTIKTTFALFRPISTTPRK